MHSVLLQSGLACTAHVNGRQWKLHGVAVQMILTSKGEGLLDQAGLVSKRKLFSCLSLLSTCTINLYVSISGANGP